MAGPTLNRCLAASISESLSMSWRKTSPRPRAAQIPWPANLSAPTLRVPSPRQSQHTPLSMSFSNQLVTYTARKLNDSRWQCIILIRQFIILIVSLTAIKRSYTAHAIDQRPHAAMSRKAGQSFLGRQNGRGCPSARGVGDSAIQPSSGFLFIYKVVLFSAFKYMYVMFNWSARIWILVNSSGTEALAEKNVAEGWGTCCDGIQLIASKKPCYDKTWTADR